MISRELAVALRDAGVRWIPAMGDRFSIVNENFVSDVFTLSDMTIEAQGPADARVLGFNGTTEWALDSVGLDDALWLPREDQLRELMGPTFVSLRAGEQGSAGFIVTVRLPPRPDEDIEAETAADAYALGVLARIAAANERLMPPPLDTRLEP
ncbi:hypothetical protein SAMN04515671_1995 [Nakamurella panacisegetis]|uniref:Pilus assembly protein CpaE n=1 Tax=Nakamurella panacisegetis TaxID=1090615 RepID=A0A1H0MEV4_9ACTN|nr:hypothetical protein [Nakamurella panacisegetis]SDO78982.1 hypothetical protein SAMN04515671_1995 [Nakamurella panacisegetis]